jgi:gamma-secretase subunit APH-1
MISKRPNSPFHWIQHAFAAGMGFGVASGMVTYIMQLVESLGPGVLPCRACPQLDIFSIGALLTSLFIFLHVTWSILAFDAYFEGHWLSMAWVVVSHLGAAASVCTFFI